MARRQLIAIRLSEPGIQAIDQLADQAHVNRSEMVRRLLGEAIAARQQPKRRS